MRQEPLNNVTLKYIQGTHIIKAIINRDVSVVSHFSSIIVMYKTGDMAEEVASLDPWQNQIEFRYKTPNKNASYQLVAQLTDDTRLALTDWFAI